MESGVACQILVAPAAVHGWKSYPRITLISANEFLRFGGGEGTPDGGFGDGAEGLGGIVLVPVQLDSAQAVGGRLEGEGMEGRICAEGAAGKLFAGGAAVTGDGATDAQEGQAKDKCRMSNDE